MPVVDQVKLSFNQPQLRYLTARRKKQARSVWGRGTGKSTVIAWQVHEIVTTMPRSCWVIVGSTYKQVLTRTLPSTIAQLEKMGYKLDRDFYIGRKPPVSAGFERPYEGPLDYDHFIIFKNGTGFHLVSLDAGGSASRGLNVDGFIGDEALLFDKNKLDADLSATNRGNGQYFGHLPAHHGVFLFSSMPWGDTGRWLLDDSKYYEQQGIDLEERQNELISAQVRFLDASTDEERLQIWRDEVLPLMRKVEYFPDKPNQGLFYSEANAFDNLTNLGLQYLLDQRKFMTDFTFMVEMMNRRPTTVGVGFYPKLNQAVHVQECANDSFILSLDGDLKKLTAAGGARFLGDVDKSSSQGDSDCRSNQPLRVSIDWGASITTLVVGQPHADKGEYRILKAFYVKHPAFINDLVEQFTTYYRYHLRKDVELLPDGERGDARREDSQWTLNEEFVRALQKKRWSIRRIDMGRIPGHPTRYQLAQTLLEEKDPSLLRIRINKLNCKDLIQALLLAPVSQDSKGKIMKVKKSERNPNFPQQHATHFTDCFDLQLLSCGTAVINIVPDFAGLGMFSRQ